MQELTKERKALNIEGKAHFGVEVFGSKYYEYMLYTCALFLCVLLWTPLMELNIYIWIGEYDVE